MKLKTTFCQILLMRVSFYNLKCNKGKCKNLHLMKLNKCNIPHKLYVYYIIMIKVCTA